MLRGLIWVLRQRRYAAFAALMVVVAAGCVIAGTWQISRFEQSVHGNRALRANARDAAVALSPAVLPTGGSAPGRLAVQYRTVRTTGHYVSGHDQFLTNQFHGSTAGFDVLTPFETGSGTIVVDRGFLGAHSDGSPDTAPAAPAGTVSLTGRLQPGTTSSVHVDSGGVVGSIAVGAPGTYRAYLSLDKKQPGGQRLIAASSPDLSNPYGGAYEAQHFAYIIQWYAFALLALAAPFWFARHEVREARKQWLGIDDDVEQFDDIPELDAAPGPAALPAGSSDAALLPAGSPDAALPVARDGGTVALAGRISPERLAQARRLADRYGRSFGPDGGESLLRPTGRRRLDLFAMKPVTHSARTPHRAVDEVHAAYNDYLWQLAMADGNIPDVAPELDRDDPGPADEE